MLRSGWFQRAVGFLAAEYLRLVWLTNRFTYDPADVYDIVEPQMPAIFAFWHGQHLLTPFIRNKPSYRAKVLISRHRDGEFNAIAVERLRTAMEEGSGRGATAAMANLAEAIQGLVGHMRTEQQMIREWADGQGEQNREIKRLLERLARQTEKS